MGSRRCRLSTEERNAAYNDYEKYKKWLEEEKLFDGSDRKCSLILIGENHFNPYNLTRHCVHPDLCIAEGINRLVQTIMRDRDGREKLSRSRVYVDEIQDYTQLEIALFFLLCSHGGLFLAGDPAQSVVEGVEFRFEEVRSVPYHLFPGDKRFIPEKPLTVTRNFRSHAGILKIAGEVRNSRWKLSVPTFHTFHTCWPELVPSHTYVRTPPFISIIRFWTSYSLTSPGVRRNYQRTKGSL